MNAISGSISGIGATYPASSALGSTRSGSAGAKEGGAASGLALPGDEVSISDRARRLAEAARAAKEEAGEASEEEAAKKSESAKDRDDAHGWAVTEMTGDPADPAGVMRRVIARGTGSLPAMYA